MASFDATEDPPPADAVLGPFFSNPNVFRREPSPTNPILSDTELASLRTFEKGHGDLPLLLRYGTSAHSCPVWFACTRDAASSRILEAELQAFIGPTWARFEGAGPERLGNGRTVTEFLAGHGLHAVRFEAAYLGGVQRIQRSLELYWGLLSRRPMRPVLELRTFAQLRAAFDSALVARHENAAREAVHVLRDTHGLTAENRLFLDIRLAAAFSRWDSIVEHPRLRDLMKVRLPPETCGDIWEALYEKHLRDYEDDGNADFLLRAFEKDVRPIAAPLLRSRGRSRRPSVLKAFLLDALSQPQPVPALCLELLGMVDAGAFGAASAGIEAKVAALQPRVGVDEARLEMDHERYEQAWALLWPEFDSIDLLLMLMRCAKEIADPARASEFVGRLNATPPEVAEAVRTARPRLLGDVETLARHRPPDRDGMPAVDPAMTNGPAADDLVEQWREIARADDAETLLRDPVRVGALVSTMENEALAGTDAFESLLPVWVEWLIERSPAQSGLLPVYMALVEALRVRDRLGESQRELMRMASRHALRAVPTPAQYGHLVGQLEGVWDDILSPRTLAWGLEVVDMLLSEPCRNESSRTRLISAVMTAGADCADRLEPGEQALFRALAKETGHALPAYAAGTVDGAVPSDPRVRVLLYSLDRHAIERAASTLSDIFPESRFVTNDDHVCTDRLRKYARSADWIVFVAGVSKHQAFFCIENERSPKSMLLYAEGTGTTRLIDRVVRQSLQS